MDTPQTKQVQVTLDVPSAQLLLYQLNELQLRRTQVEQLNSLIARDQELDTREKAVAQRELDAEKKNSELLARERDIYKEQADAYKNLYEIARKSTGCGFWGKVARFFTLGSHRCKG